MADAIRQTRFRGTVSLAPEVRFSTGAATSMAALANFFDGVASEQADRLDLEAKEAAEKKGVEVGALGPFDKREDDTIASRAFNEAALQSYTNKVDTDARLKLLELQEKHKIDPEGFLKASQGYIAGVRSEAQNISPELAQQVKGSWDIYSAGALSKINKAHSEVVTDQQRADVLRLKRSMFEGIEANRNDVIGDEETATNWFQRTEADWSRMEVALRGRRPDGLPMFTEEQIETERQAFQSKVMVESVKAWVDAQPDPVAAIDALEKGDVAFAVQQRDEDGNLTGETVKLDPREQLTDAEFKKTIAYAEEQFTKAKQQDARIAHTNAAAVAELELAVARGDKGVEAIEQAREEGLFVGNEGKYVSISKQAITAQQKQRGTADAIGRVSNAIATEGVFLDPTSKADKDAADAYWVQTTNVLDSIPEDQPGAAEQKAAVRGTALVNFIAKTNILPKSERVRISTFLAAGTTGQKIEAADLVARLQEIGRTGDLFTKGQIAKALTINQFVRAGRDPVEAVEAAEEATKLENKPLFEARRGEIKNEKFANDYPGILESAFDPIGPFNDAELTNIDGTKARMVDEYKTLFENWYQRLGDEDAAKEQAMNEFKRVWGTTEVDGNLRAMKYPPEAFYGFGDDDWMATQLRDDVGAALGKTIEKNGVFVGSDSETARTASTGRPTYPIILMDESGRFIEAKKDGVPLRWRPDSASVKGKRKTQSVAKARQIREQGLIDQADPLVSSIQLAP